MAAANWVRLIGKSVSSCVDVHCGVTVVCEVVSLLGVCGFQYVAVHCCV